MGTMVKMYIHVLLVDIHESSLFRKCESDFIKKNNKMFKCVAYFRHNQTKYIKCNSEEQKQLVL